MRVWKIQASDSDDWLPSSWGYVLANTAEEAIQIAASASSKRLIRAHKKHSSMLWSGATNTKVDWTSS
jgi:hypothetical protein